MARVATGKVTAVFLSVDPLSAQPNEPDIRALLRVCNVHNVSLAMNLATADLNRVVATAARVVELKENNNSVPRDRRFHRGCVRVGALAPSVVDRAGKETKQPAAASKTAPMDINSASEGAALYRRRPHQEDRGCPYQQKDELVKKAIVPQPTCDKIKDQIVARQKSL